MEADQLNKPDSPAPPDDDLIMPFQAELAGASGRLVRLGPVVDSILTGHAYPESVSKLLGEAVALTAMFGAALKFDGTFIMQTRTDGPVSLLVVDYTVPGNMRGYAGFDAERVEALERDGEADPGTLLGHGHLAMTVDQGPDMESYQGVVALEGGDLNAAADTYFRQSEQLPTFIRVAVARHYTAGPGGGQGQWQWRAGGLMLQNLGREGGRRAAGMEPDADGWNRACTLAGTVQDQELVDPLLAPERLLYRLFHEERVRAYRTRPLHMHCGCSEDRVKALLASFGPGELADMVRDGKIVVTCEFCNRIYEFPAGDYV